MKEERIKLEKIRNKVFYKIFNKDSGVSFNNKLVKFNCLNCGKEVEAFFGSSLGYTLLCKNCFNEKYNEFQKKKYLSFLDKNPDIRNLWIQYFKDMKKEVK